MNSFQPIDARLRVAYATTPLSDLLAEPDVLAVLGFGAGPPVGDDARVFRIGLEAVAAPAPLLEVWRGAGPVVHGHAGAIAWSSDGAFQFVALEWPEDGDLAAATEAAYATLRDFLAGSGCPHPLKLWNYIDAITEGEGDAERYRRFCVGRARVLPHEAAEFPAATAIGRRDGRRVLQIYGLSAARPGTPLENPRQLSAWRYPRAYGPQPPQFARGMLPFERQGPLAMSGTASILGHETRHRGQFGAQLDETLGNLRALLESARARAPWLSAEYGAQSLLKVYLRDIGNLGELEAWLDARLTDVPRLILHGDVCRRDLLVEIDGFHG